MYHSTSFTARRALHDAARQSIVPPVILDIVKCGHPVLREKGKRIERVTPEIRQLAANMIETMYAANGVGLAAQQVARALLLTVIDVVQSDQPSELLIDGRPQNIADRMPLVLINPHITHREGEIISEEGCLSVPEVTATIRRASRVSVEAENLDRHPLRLEAAGLLARALQHEIDHLNGILFLDRMDAATRASLAGKIKKLTKETQESLKKPSRRSFALR